MEKTTTIRGITLIEALKLKNKKQDEQKKEPDCQNCKFFNKEKISCSHYLWNRCVVRDDKDYVIYYNYHQFINSKK